MIDKIIDTKKQLENSDLVIMKLLRNYRQLIKYVIAGGTAAITDLLLLFFLHDIVEVNVIIAATLAFVVAFFVSFFLQKFWTFRDNSREKIKQQMGIYFTVGVLNAGANAWGMNLLVNGWQVWYLLAQVIVAGSIALYSFVLYRFVIFKKT